MGIITSAFESASRSGRIDFAAVSRATLAALDRISSHYLPDGRRDGSEWVSRNPTRADASLGSFKFNLQNGVWADFATGDKGGDAIDLVAYVSGKSKLDAARELADMLGVVATNAPVTTSGTVHQLPRRVSKVASPEAAGTAPESFPVRTAPDADGKPRFVVAGDEGPCVRDGEKRRHIYKRGGVPVRIKVIRNGDAGALNIYRVRDGSTTGWQYSKPVDFEATPYTYRSTRPFTDRLDRQLHWVEGEKDCETLTRAGLSAFTFGGTGDGLPTGCEEYLRNRNVVILADNDDAGRKHAADKVALALTVAASVKLVGFEEMPDKSDVTDWIEAGHSVMQLEGRIRAAPELKPDAIQPLKAEEEPTGLPYGYRMKRDGLYWTDPNDDEKPAIKLSGPFKVVAETRDGDGSNWGILLHWVDRDGKDHSYALPKAMLAGDGSDARRVLLSEGLFVAPGQKARQQFNSFLLQTRSQARARATQRIGWHASAFVLPDTSFGSAQNDKLLLQTATAHEHTFRQAGSLESWQHNIARYAVGNSRLVIALSAAFAGPLVGPCAAEGGGIHFRGGSSTGKSTALHVAGSVWGGGSVTGFVRSWRTTANGLEGVAQAHCDTLLCLDELSQLPAKDAGEAAYMLANGSGKSRSARDGSARRAASWRVLFVSSGEVSLADRIAEEGRGRKAAAGQHVRIIDIAADAGAGMGMFENIHGFDSAEALARHLREATQQHFGVAARKYLEALVPTINDLQQQVATITRAFCEAAVPKGADGQVLRVAQRLALIAAGGEVATLAGILPWEQGEAVAAARKCFEGWLLQRGGHEPAEERAGIEQVSAFLLANGQARFIPAWEDEARTHIPIRDVAGYRQKDGDGWEFYVTSPAWKEICAGLDPRRVASVMAAKGFIVSGEGSHLSKMVRVPEHGRLRLYHIASSFLEGSENA